MTGWDILRWGTFVAWVLLIAFDTSVEGRIFHMGGAAFSLVMAIVFGGKENGSHRRADQEIRGDTDQRADAGGGPVYAACPSGTIALTPIAGPGSSGAGAGAGVTAVLSSSLINQQIAMMQAMQAQAPNNILLGMQQGQQAQNAYQGGLGQQNVAQGCISSAQYQAASQANVSAFLQQFGSPNLFPPQPKPVVENIGIVLGEIEGYRAWRIFNGCLVSLCVDDVWLPGEPMMATDVNEDNTNGAHAFKTLRQAVDYAAGYEHVAIGRVKLWGQIIEHEIGYRAEFSKPIEILHVRWTKIGGALGTAEEIAKRYGIKTGPMIEVGK